MSNKNANTIEKSDIMVMRVLSDYHVKNQAVPQCICQNIGLVYPFLLRSTWRKKMPRKCQCSQNFSEDCT